MKLAVLHPGSGTWFEVSDNARLVDLDELLPDVLALVAATGELPADVDSSALSVCLIPALRD